MFIGVYAGAEALEVLVVTRVRRSHWYRPNNVASCYHAAGRGIVSLMCLDDADVGGLRPRPLYVVVVECLTFRQHASSISDRRFATLQRTLFIYLINKYISLSDICLTVHH